MKYVSPKYESTALEVNDIIMSAEPSYTINEGSDNDGNRVGDVTISAGSIFGQYFN
jgi:hypothetical protein